MGPSGQFSAPHRLEVRCSGVSELRTLWNEQLSRGGLFVETTASRPTNLTLELALSTPHGTLTLAALVVHVATNTGSDGLQTTGLGLQLVDLSAETKQSIMSYVEGRSHVLANQRSGDAADADVDAAVAQARCATRSPPSPATSPPPRGARPLRRRRGSRPRCRRWGSCPSR
jgi:hypothetical protein